MHYLIILFLLTGCGAIENLGRNCGGDMKEGCRTIFGGEWDEEQDKKVSTIAAKVKQLELLNYSLMSIVFDHESMLADTYNEISTITNSITNINNIIPTLADASAVNNLTNTVFTLQTDLSLLTDRVATLESSIGTPVTGLQSVVTQNTITILQLQQNHNVTKMVDPCGDAPGKYDEIFLRTSTGKLIASFSDAASGLNTRFSELLPGTYTTTDGTGCSFAVTNMSGVLTVIPSVEY